MCKRTSKAKKHFSKIKFLKL